MIKTLKNQILEFCVELGTLHKYILHYWQTNQRLILEEKFEYAI